MTYFIPEFRIEPVYGTLGVFNTTEVVTFKVVDQAGNTWHVGTLSSCKGFIKFYT